MVVPVVLEFVYSEDRECAFGLVKANTSVGRFYAFSVFKLFHQIYVSFSSIIVLSPYLTNPERSSENGILHTNIEYWVEPCTESIVLIPTVPTPSNDKDIGFSIFYIISIGGYSLIEDIILATISNTSKLLALLT
jgi:hypothetical protein